MLDIDYQFRPRQLRALLLLLMLLPFVPAVITFRFMFESSELEKRQLNEEAQRFYQSHLELVTKAAVESFSNQIRELAEARSADDFTEILDQMNIAGAWPETLVPESDEAFSRLHHQAAAQFAKTAAAREWRPLEEGSPIYGCLLRPGFSNEGVVLLQPKEQLLERFRSLINSAFGSEGQALVSASGAPFPQTGEDLLLTTTPGSLLPNWRVGIELRPGLWQSEYSQQATFYLYTALILGAVILGISALAAVEVHKQLRLQSHRLTALAVLAHELKTPIASSRVLLDTLQARESPSPDFLKDYLGLLHEENERLARTVQNLLTFARFEMGRASAHRTELQVNELIRELARTAESRALPETTWHLELEPSLPSIEADRTLLSLALNNLLDNALKYSDPPRVISLVSRSVTGGIEIEVGDNGRGISPEQQKKVFEAFQQADSNLSRTNEGCGLGLGIVRHVSRIHGGTVRLISQPGNGSRFILFFRTSRNAGT